MNVILGRLFCFDAQGFDFKAFTNKNAGRMPALSFRAAFYEAQFTTDNQFVKVNKAFESLCGT